MRNLFCFFVVCFFLCNLFLEAHEESKKGSIEELLSSCSGSIEIKNGEIGLNPDRTWSFNDQIYILNDSEQWILAGNKILNSVDEYIQDHANRGICFKGHRGEYLDRSFYPKGVWCCRGFYNGEKCPYHIDRQFPNGIPRGDRLTCLPNDLCIGKSKEIAFLGLDVKTFIRPLSKLWFCRFMGGTKNPQG